MVIELTTSIKNESTDTKPLNILIKPQITVIKNF